MNELINGKMMAVGEELPKTDLEKSLLIKQAMQFQDELINKLQKENEIMKPKAFNYDKFMYSEEYKSITEFANVSGIGRNELHTIILFIQKYITSH